MKYESIRGMNISKLSLGTVQLGLEYGIANKLGKPNTAASFDILRTACEGGINSIDTAEAYGNSEAVVGDFISSLKSEYDNLVITTKIKLMPEEVTTSNIENCFFEHASKSLERLRIKSIPVYMLHSAGDMFLYKDKVQRAFERLKEEGLIEKAGVSVYTSDEAAEMLKYDVFEAIQLPMNIFDNRLVADGSIKKLKDADIIVFVRSIFLQGLFFMDPDELTGNLADASSYLKMLREIADAQNISIAQLALSYIRDMEGVTSLVVGAENTRQVNENITLMNAPVLPDEIRKVILNEFINIKTEILNPGLWKR